MNNEIIDPILGKLTIDCNGDYSGQISLGNNSIEINLCMDEIEPSNDHVEEVRLLAIKNIKKLDEAFLKSMTYKAAHQVTESAYENQFTEEDILKLNKDMKLRSIDFLIEGLMLSWDSPNIFKEDFISMQLDEDLNIEEVVIQWQN